MQGTPFFEQLQNDFAQWLERLGYAKSSIKGNKRRIGYFLSWLENKHIHTLEEIAVLHLKQYQKHLEVKADKNGGSLTSSTIQGYLSTLKLFDQYLFKYSYPVILKTKLQVTPELEYIPTILTQKEIKQVYRATSEGILGYRDRAMLSIYYGCGLRCSEGTRLQLSDLDLKKGILLVRKSKNYRQRYVPMSEKVKKDLHDWLLYGRPLVLKQEDNHVLVHSKGKYKDGKTCNNRLKKLVSEAGIDKKITLHGLRHSIATHLLQSGMQLEQIRQFLGHSSLETTQRYTHIVENGEV